MWRDMKALKAQMELEAHSKSMVDTILFKVRAQCALVEDYLSGTFVLNAAGEGDEDLEAEDEDAAAGSTRSPRWTTSQSRLWDRTCPVVENAVAAANAEDDDEAEDFAREAAETNRIVFANGPPGTGKTYVVHQLIKHWVAKGARVLFVLPTGQLASEMRVQHPTVDVDTYHGGLWFHRDLSEALGIMTQYDLIILDEVSMLTDKHFDRVVAMWQAADKLPCILLLGDFWQLPIVESDASRCEESCLWRPNVKVVNFTEQVRCKDQALQKKLDVLRTSVPSERQLRRILKKHWAWKTARPSPWDVLELLREHPETTIVTCTRKAAALVNELATQVLFQDRHKRPLATIPLDYLSNADNYVVKDNKTQLKDGPLQPLTTEVYEGQRVFLTRNLDKENGFVNGMAAVIESYDPAGQCLTVVTKQGKPLALHKCSDEVDGRRDRVVSFPVRIGYATTIQKIQGATLPHCTVWLDQPGCKAAAYVAMSRVQRDEDYLIAGAVGTKHFVPAM